MRDFSQLKDRYQSLTIKAKQATAELKNDLPKPAAYVWLGSLSFAFFLGASNVTLPLAPVAGLAILGAGFIGSTLGLMIATGGTGKFDEMMRTPATVATAFAIGTGASILHLKDDVSRMLRILKTTLTSHQRSKDLHCRKRSRSPHAEGRFSAPHIDLPPIKESKQNCDSAIHNGLFYRRAQDGAEDIHDRADYRAFAAGRSAAVAGQAAGCCHP